MRCALAVLTCLFLVALTVAISAEEQTIKKADVPSAVIAAFEKAYPKATVKNYSTEQHRGKTSYEIESIDGSTHRNVEYSPQGELLEIEEALKPSDLPPKVSQAITTKYAGGDIVSAEKKIKGDKTVYKVKMLQDKAKIEVRVNPEGEFIAPKHRNKDYKKE
jgi:uncharacterized membrane protein YkoI